MERKSGPGYESGLILYHVVAEHNLPFATVDHFTQLYKKMFLDNAIADQYSRVRIKTRSNVLAPAVMLMLLADLSGSYATMISTIKSTLRLWFVIGMTVVELSLVSLQCLYATLLQVDALNAVLSEQGIPYTNMILLR